MTKSHDQVKNRLRKETVIWIKVLNEIQNLAVSRSDQLAEHFSQRELCYAIH